MPKTSSTSPSKSSSELPSSSPSTEQSQSPSQGPPAGTAFPVEVGSVWFEPITCAFYGAELHLSSRKLIMRDRAAADSLKCSIEEPLRIIRPFD